jgi:hypothetical protein
MKQPKPITPAEALDRLLTNFTGQGWRDDGNAARAVVEAATSGESVGDGIMLARAVPETFLLANRITRTQVQAVIVQALRGVQIVPSEVQPQVTLGKVVMTNVRINNTGNWVGNVGGHGGIVGVTQSQRNLDKRRVKALTVKYRSEPAAREIVDSPSPADERKSKLARLIAHAEGVGIEFGAKVASNLIQGK